MRKKTKEVKIGKVKIGNNNPVLIQSMTTTDTADADATIKQIHQLEEAGCEIVRVSVPFQKSVEGLKQIRENITIPLVADIHFDYKMAIESAPYVDKLRINPGNIGSDEKVKEVITTAKEFDLPIRIGVNLGSLEIDLEKKYGLTPKAMVASALHHIKILEDHDFHNIVVSLKASDVPRSVEAYRLFSEQSDYPLHIGITESGSGFTGGIKSSVGLGMLLAEGIGDTMRVSLSADPVEEVKVGWQILKSLQIRKRGVEVTSCPTCARNTIDVFKVVKQLEEYCEKVKKDIHISVMGCSVNGPGEAKSADLGIVGMNKAHILYKRGKVVGKVQTDDIFETLKKEIDAI